MDKKRERIRELNDAFRKSFVDGRIILTMEVQALEEASRAKLLKGVQEFDVFSERNDPYCEHDFGSIDIEHERYYWKIDYYDQCLKFGSNDPSDPNQTTRVMTIMHAREY